MTKGQKIIVLVSAITISVVVGGLLYLYFNRKSLIGKLKKGEEVNIKLNELKSDNHEAGKYFIFIPKELSGEPFIGLKYDGNQIGKYFLEDSELYYSEKDGEKNKVTDKDEVKLIKYLLKKLEK